MNIILAVAAASILFVVALVHIYWAFGGRWPGHSERSLAETVVGPTPGGKMPGMLACLAVAAALVVAAFLPLQHTGLVSLPVPAWVTYLGSWVVVAVITLRGIGGFFERTLRPNIIGMRYDRLNRLIYSPLCIVLATLLVGSAWPA